MIDNWSWSSVEIIDEGCGRVNPEMMINCRQEVACRTSSFDGIFPEFIGGSNDSSGLDASTGPEIRKRSRPVIATRLLGTGGRTRIPGSGAG
jgi:hypothetical protein